MKKLGIIPARYGSSRFEGKPLALIEGKTMIEWVYKRSLNSDLDAVVVATDDKRIYDTVLEFGGEVIMTSSNHESGTDRIAEVANIYKEYEIVINIQGDEPLIESEMINQVIEPFLNNKEILMTTLKHKIKNREDLNNPNIVKVITDINDFAIYFSRNRIPYARDNSKIDYFRHVGIYGYTREFLIMFSNMKPSILEKMEKLEQLRVLENAYKIKVLETEFSAIGVDTQSDLDEVCRIIRENGIKL